MSWSSIRQPLPCTGWTILNPDGRMILDPVPTKEIAERLAGDNVGGSLKKALKRGYLIVEIQMRLVA